MDASTETVELDTTEELVDIPFDAPKHSFVEDAARDYRQQQRFHVPLICAAADAPKIPLLKQPIEPFFYDMTPEWGGRISAYLRVVSDSSSQYEIDVPLRMLQYKTPKDSKKCFDLKACQEVDTANLPIERHNKFITSLLSMFINRNGCGVSAGHITLPPPPENLVETRISRLKTLFKDKYGATVLAVRYLAGQGKICETDYAIDNAVEAANVEAYEQYIREKRAKGQFRFRIPGSPPTFWDGIPDHRDRLGRRVMWERDETHSFLSPAVNIKLANDELATL